MKSKLLIFDGTSVLAEFYYKTLTLEVEELHSLKESGKSISKEEEDKAYSTLLQAKEGVYINAVQGFFKQLFETIDKVKPSHLIVTWGAERENNFRRKIFPGYKDDGKVKDRALIEQEKLTKLMLSNIGIHQVQGFEYESLDLAGTIAEKFKNQMDIEIFARNMQSLQFTDIATVWFKTPNYEDIIRRHNLDSYNYPKGTVKFDSKFLFEYKNLQPHQIPDFRALVGNSFSKIPGIKSVGQVTTTALLEEYGSLENLYEDIDSCTTREELIDFGRDLTDCLMLAFNPIEFLVKGRNEAFLGKELATYKRDISIDEIDNLNESIFLVDKIDKTKILKELKNINLCPIKANITSKLSSTISRMEFSALIITYNPHIFSSKSVIFVKNAKSLEDFIPTEIESENGLVLIIKIHDNAIVNFRDKIKVDISNCSFYSESEVNNRIKERERIQNERCIAEITNAFSTNIQEHHSSPVVCPSGIIIGDVEEVEYEVEEYEEEYDDILESEACVEVEAEEVVAVTSPIESSNLNTFSNTAKSNISSNNANATSGLQLIESLVINRYYCGCCNNEFALIGSTASFCTSCGAKMEGNIK